MALAHVQVVVAAFQAPAPPTQVAFFFHSTEIINPCMWATDLDLQQTAYPASNCNGCMVCSQPRYNHVWQRCNLEVGRRCSTRQGLHHTLFCLGNQGQAEDGCTFTSDSSVGICRYATLDAAGCKRVIDQFMAYDAMRCAGPGAWQVHRGFLRAFQLVVANRLPGYTLDAVATNITGFRPADMTLCVPVPRQLCLPLQAQQDGVKTCLVHSI